MLRLVRFVGSAVCQPSSEATVDLRLAYSAGLESCPILRQLGVAVSYETVNSPAVGDSIRVWS
jgi:hypothetical protein